MITINFLVYTKISAKIAPVMKSLITRIKKRKRLLIIVIIIAVVVFIIIRARGNGNSIETGTVEFGRVDEILTLSGEIKAHEHVSLAYGISGKTSLVNVKEGDDVKKGQLLGKLDTISLNSDYERAKADLRSAEATVQRVHDDVKNHSSDETFTQKETRTAAEVSYDKAYEALKKAEEALKSASLFSPFSGIVSFIANPYSGVNITAATKQFEVINPSTIYFSVAADQNEVIKIKEGMDVEIVLDPIEDKTFKGAVHRVSLTPGESEISATYGVWVNFVDLPMSDFTYRVGMTGDANFLLSFVDETLFVSPSFVKSDSEGTYLVTDNGKVYVEIGIEGDDRTQIKGDVAEGQTIYD